MLKTIKNVLTIILILVIVAGLVYGFFYLTNRPKPTSQGTPSIDISAVVQYTPTWGPGDVKNLVATAVPTPYARKTVPEIAAMNKALADKKTLISTDILVGSQFKAINIEQYCTNIKLGSIDMGSSTIGSAVLRELQWDMGVSLGDLTFTMEEGTSTVPVYHAADENGNPYTETQSYGVLVITASDFGINGPTILSGNEQVFSSGDPLGLYKLWLIPRELITGQDLIGEKSVMVTNMAMELVNLETLVPNGSDENLKGLYREFVNSFSTSGEGHIYDTLIAIFDPMAKEHGFAGIEKVVFKLPPQPLTIYGWQDYGDMPLVPTDYPAKFADNLCPNEPAPEVLEALKGEK